VPKDDRPHKGRGSNREKEDPPKHRRHHREERHGTGGEQKVFGELVQRRLGGGATPTAQAYAMAMQQWQQLPGAVQFVAVPRFPKSDCSPRAHTGGAVDQHPIDRKKTGESA
jgi:hypothetical protein